MTALFTSRSEALLNRVIRWLIYGLLIFMPLSFGAVEGWSQAVVVAVTGLIALGLAVRLFLQPRRSVAALKHWALLPIAGFILLVVIQVIPLPTRMIGLASPHTVETKTRLLADSPDAANFLRRMTLTFYPHATRAGLRIILCAAAVFCGVLSFFRRTKQIRQLLIVVAATGAAIAVLALAQDLSGAQAIYWKVPIYAAAHGGTFVNHNNFAQFMNLSIGAALGLLLASLGRAPAQSPWSLSTQTNDNPKRVVARWLGVAIVVMAASIFLSKSRGGMVSLIVAGVLIGILVSVSKRMRGRGWVFVPLAMALLVLLMVAGLDAVTGRLASVRQVEVAAGARVQIIKDVWAGLIPKFPIFGVGLGTHEFVYPLVSHQTFARLAGNVENEYVQCLEEVGIVGVALMAAFLATIAAAWVRAIRRRNKRIQVAAFGLGFSLIAILVGSASDFGERLPAIACLTAVVCGLIVNLSRMSDSKRRESQVRAVWPVKWAAVVIVVGTWAWAQIGAVRWAMGEHEAARAQEIDRFLERENWQGNNGDFIELLKSAKAASDWQSDDVELRHWLNVYRWYTLIRPDPNTGRPIIDDQARAWAKEIVANFHAARALCPTFGPPYCVAGQIELFFLNDPRGEAHILQGYELAPYSPEACFVAAALDVKRGRLDDSLVKAKRALVLGQNGYDLLNLYIVGVDRPDLARRLFEGDLYGLMRLADRLDAEKRHADVAAEARSQAMALVVKRVAEPDPPGDVLAMMGAAAMARKDFAGAIDWYGRAIETDYADVGWHLSRAQALAALSRDEEASREAWICLRLRPNMYGARKLIEDLSVKAPATRAATTGVSGSGT